MKLGIRAHDLGKQSPEDLVTSLKEHHFHHIQLVLNKAVEANGSDSLISCESLVEQMSMLLDQSTIEVSMLGAYFNPIHSNKEKVQQGIENFKSHLRQAKKLKARLVGSETGSYNDDQWTFHEQNDSEEAFIEVKRIFSELLEVAKEEECFVAIEPAYQHVISSPKRLKRLLDELNHSQVVITFDLFNLLHIGNYHAQHQVIDEMIDLFADKIRIVHAKDFTIENQQIKQVAPGQGLLDYPYLLTKLRKLNEEPIIIFEGVVGEDIQSSQAYLNHLVQELSLHI